MFLLSKVYLKPKQAIHNPKIATKVSTVSIIPRPFILGFPTGSDRMYDKFLGVKGLDLLPFILSKFP